MSHTKKASLVREAFSFYHDGFVQWRLFRKHGADRHSVGTHTTTIQTKITPNGIHHQVESTDTIRFAFGHKRRRPVIATFINSIRIRFHTTTREREKYRITILCRKLIADYVIFCFN